MARVSNSLKTWFVIHFVVDYLFGIPLLLFPQWTLSLFGFAAVETLTARLVGAALIGIGGISLFARNEGKESYNSLLTLKLIWSSAAILAILLTIIEGAPVLSWLILLIFVIFNVIWIYYKQKLR